MPGGRPDAMARHRAGTDASRVSVVYTTKRQHAGSGEGPPAGGPPHPADNPMSRARRAPTLAARSAAVRSMNRVTGRLAVVGGQEHCAVRALQAAADRVLAQTQRAPAEQHGPAYGVRLHLEERGVTH